MERQLDLVVGQVGPACEPKSRATRRDSRRSNRLHPHSVRMQPTAPRHRQLFSPDDDGKNGALPTEHMHSEIAKATPEASPDRGQSFAAPVVSDGFVNGSQCYSG